MLTKLYVSVSFMVLAVLLIDGFTGIGSKGDVCFMEDLGWFKAFSKFFKRLNTANLKSDPSLLLLRAFLSSY